jgi:hypothetical protein
MADFVSIILRTHTGSRASSSLWCATPSATSQPFAEGEHPSAAWVSRVALISVCRHAVVITPVARRVRSLVGQPIPTVSPSSPAAAAFPLLVQDRRTHWTFRGLLNVHSRHGLPARCIAKATHLSRRLRRFRHLRRRSDSYRLERPSCRLGIAPTEEQHLYTAHTNCVRVSLPERGAGSPDLRSRPGKPRWSRALEQG